MTTEADPVEAMLQELKEALDASARKMEAEHAERAAECAAAWAALEAENDFEQAIEKLEASGRIAGVGHA